jgi:flagellar hook-length control protein FliK
MPTNASDILNGLLGVGPLAGTGQGKQPTGLGITEGPPIFSDILGLLTNPTLTQISGDNPTVEIDSQTRDQNSFETTLNNELGGQISSVWMLGRPEAVAGQPFTNLKVADDKMSSQTGLDAKPEFSGATQSNQTAVFQALSPNVQKVLAVDAVELTSGEYRVLAADVTNSSLNLTLESSDHSQINVTLPLDQLLSGGAEPINTTKAFAPGSIDARRVAMDSTINPSRDLALWFSKLNLSELRVETVNTSANDKGTTSFKLTFAEPGITVAQSFEAVLPNVEIRAFRIQNQSGRRGVAINKSDNSGPSSSGAELAMPLQTRGGRVSLVIQKPVIKAAVLDAGVDMAVFGQSKENGLSLTGNFQGQAADLRAAQTQSGGDKIQYAPVRFTLPDTIEHTLVPNGRSLTLKIQPEHLGPARLSLHFNSEGLTARVTVDSPVAQAVIERSLDRLHEQLTQAGVKVDRLEVSLSGGFTRDQLFQQGSQWRRPPTDHNRLHVPGYQNADSTPVGTAGPIDREYLNSRGVNLFA